MNVAPHGRRGWALILGVAPYIFGACTTEAAQSAALSLAFDTLLESDTLLEINGTQLFVHREGSGEPAIVIHGGPVLDHGYLLPHLAPLGDTLDLVFYDQRLSGRSDGSVDSASVRLDTFVADIEALRTVLGLGRVHLIAHSWGGLLAMKYAVAHPENLRSLILLDGMAPTADLWQQENVAQAMELSPADTAGIGALLASQEFTNRDPDAIATLLRLQFRSQFRNPALAADLAFHLESDYGERSRQFGYMTQDLMSYDILTELHEVLLPTLVLYGEDEVGLRIGGKALIDAIPGASLVSIPAAGHFPFIDNPEAFHAAVREFLGSIPGSDSSI